MTHEKMAALAVACSRADKSEKASDLYIKASEKHIIYRTDGRAIALCGRAETQQIRHLRDIILVPQMLFLELI